MMDSKLTIKDITQLLIRFDLEAFTESVTKIKWINDEDKFYSDLFRIQNNQGESLILKVRNKSSLNIKCAVDSLSVINDPSNFIEKYTQVFSDENYYYLFTDWIDGSNPIQNKIEVMPKVFSLLANIHAINTSNGPFFSKYSDGRISDSINHLVDSEVDYHMSFFNLPHLKKDCKSIIEKLKTGIPCLVHEDVHPGNVLEDTYGNIKLIDCEWLHAGLNLYEFEYVQLYDIRDKNWWDIDECGLSCYKEYFSSLKLDNVTANSQIKAFEMLKIFRLNTYWEYFKMSDNLPKIKSTIEMIIDTDQFI
jgi:hypothetical protein